MYRHSDPSMTTSSTATDFAAPGPRPRSLSALHRLLDAGQGFAPSYRGEMSNHLPMALHAAWELGADARRLRAQFDHDAPLLETFAAPTPMAPRNPKLPWDWTPLRGQTAAYAVLRAGFDDALSEEAPEAVLRRVLPELLPGLHAFAFHGLIRTAHAWESGHRGELASALATWAAWWEVLPTGREFERRDRLDIAAWARLLRERSAGWRSTQPMILRRMHDASRTALFDLMAERLALADDLAQQRERMLEVARDAYLHSRNFTLLHMITGLRALRVLLPLAGPLDGPQDAALQGAVARAAVAAWMAGQVQWAAEAPVSTSLSWADLRPMALAQFDDHAIKLVHACWQEDQRRPDAKWRAVAALVLRTEALARQAGRPAR